MTTIAADVRAGLMASDSYWTDGDQNGVVRKVYRYPGFLVGFAGTYADITEARRWFKTREGKPKNWEVSGLILSPGKIQLWTPIDGFVDEQSPTFAIGSGGAAARAAMLAGADVSRAVRIACTIDAGSGGRVRVYRLR